MASILGLYGDKVKPLSANRILANHRLQVDQIRIGSYTGKGVILSKDAVEKLAVRFAPPDLAAAA